MLFDVAQMMELAKYRATAIRRMGLRPHMSESFAQIGTTAVVAMTYEAPIQEYPDAERRSEHMVGIAVATIVVFRAAMNRVDWQDSQFSQNGRVHETRLRPALIRN